MPNLNIYLAESPYINLVKSAEAMGKSGSILAAEILTAIVRAPKLRLQFGLPPA